MAEGCVAAEGCVGGVVPEGFVVAEGWLVAEGWEAGVAPETLELEAPGFVLLTTVAHAVAVADADVVLRKVASALKAVDVSALDVAPAPVR